MTTIGVITSVLAMLIILILIALIVCLRWASKMAKAEKKEAEDIKFELLEVFNNNLSETNLNWKMSMGMVLMRFSELVRKKPKNLRYISWL